MQTPRRPHSIPVPVSKCFEEAQETVLTHGKPRHKRDSHLQNPILLQTQRHTLSVQEIMSIRRGPRTTCVSGGLGLGSRSPLLHCLLCCSVLPGGVPGRCEGSLPVLANGERVERQMYSEEIQIYEISPQVHRLKNLYWKRENIFAKEAY